MDTVPAPDPDPDTQKSGIVTPLQIIPRAQVCGRGGAPPERRPGPHRRTEARSEEREQVHVGAVRLLGLQRGGRRVQQAAPHLGQLQARLHSAHHRVPGTGEKFISNFLFHCQFSILYTVYRKI